MLKEHEQRLQQLAQRLFELSAWRDRMVININGKFKSAIQSDWTPVQKGFTWSIEDEKAFFQFEPTIPESWHGLPVNICIWPGGESLLKINREFTGGINPFHKEYPLTHSAECGKQYLIELESVPRLLFGQPIEKPCLEEASLIIPEPVVRELFNDLYNAFEAAEYLAKNNRQAISDRLVDLLLETFTKICVPHHNSLSYLTRIIKNTGYTRSPGVKRLAQIVQGLGEESHGISSVWENWKFDEPLEPLSAETLNGLESVRIEFQKQLQNIKKDYPAEGNLYLSGHAHIDLAWLWPIKETENKIERTFATALNLLKRYPNFYFNQSSAHLYELIEKRNPEMFKAIQKRVKEGRWDLVGGMWVEPDCTMPSGESLVRQLVFGQQYFMTKFDKESKVAWLPDTFGFCGNLPQILKQAGIDYFFTIKLNWNESNPNPYDMFFWEGIDGSRVLAHCFHNPHHVYNGRIEAKEIADTWKNFKGKRYNKQSLFTFGYGDGGGGPTDDMLESFERLKDFPGMPRLQMGPMNEFFKNVRTDKIPTWVGEQYAEFHRAIYTTQANIKKLNRQLEQALFQAETVSSLAGILLNMDYPKDKLDNAWKILLRNQFHDILPGSSINTVYQVAEKEMGESLQQINSLKNEAINQLSKEIKNLKTTSEGNIVVWNFHLQSRPLIGHLPSPDLEDFLLQTADGDNVSYQKTDQGIFVSEDSINIPGLGYLALAIVKNNPESIKRKLSNRGLTATDSRLENPYLRVSINPDGTIGSLLDKSSGYEALQDRGNQIWAYKDIPRQYEAWDIDINYHINGEEIKALKPPKLIEAGPARASIEVIRQYGKSKIKQIYSLSKCSKCLEVKTHITWQGRRSLLKALFPLTIRSHEAWFETAFGAVPRSTHRNTSMDVQNFEVPSHRWVDMSEGNFGVSLLNNSKYGHSAKNNCLGLSLLKSPIYPDPLADEGEHQFSYSLFPHKGTWRNGTVEEAAFLNAPLEAVYCKTPTGNWTAVQQFFGMDSDSSSLQLSAFKQCESSEDYVLRYYEAKGERGRYRYKTNLPIECKGEVDLLEQKNQKAGSSEMVDQEFAFSPFQVFSLKFERS